MILYKTAQTKRNLAIIFHSCLFNTIILKCDFFKAALITNSLVNINNDSKTTNKQQTRATTRSPESVSFQTANHVDYISTIILIFTIKTTTSAIRLMLVYSFRHQINCFWDSFDQRQINWWKSWEWLSTRLTADVPSVFELLILRTSKG